MVAFFGMFFLLVLIVIGRRLQSGTEPKNLSEVARDHLEYQNEVDARRLIGIDSSNYGENLDISVSAELVRDFPMYPQHPNLSGKMEKSSSLSHLNLWKLFPSFCWRRSVCGSV